MTQPYAQPGGYPAGRLVLNLRKPLGPLSGSMVTPVATIDGYPAAVHWGQNVFPAPAGERLVVCSARYLWEFGRAEMVVGVPPGVEVHVHYTPPIWTFMRGRMGWNQQPWPGILGLWLLIGLPVLILLLVIAGVLANG